MGLMCSHSSISQDYAVDQRCVRMCVHMCGPRYIFLRDIHTHQGVVLCGTEWRMYTYPATRGLNSAFQLIGLTSTSPLWTTLHTSTGGLSTSARWIWLWALEWVNSPAFYLQEDLKDLLWNSSSASTEHPKKFGYAFPSLHIYIFIYIWLHFFFLLPFFFLVVYNISV